MRLFIGKCPMQFAGECQTTALSNGSFGWTKLNAWFPFSKGAPAPPTRLLLPALPARALRSACRQPIQVFADLLRGQGAQEFLRRQRLEDFPPLLRRERLEDFPAVFGRQSFQRLTLLFGRQLREMLLDVLALEVLH